MYPVPVPCTPDPARTPSFNGRANVSPSVPYTAQVPEYRYRRKSRGTRAQRRTYGEYPIPSGPAPTDPKLITFRVRRSIATTWFVPWSVTYA